MTTICIILIAASIISAIFFYKKSKDANEKNESLEQELKITTQINNSQIIEIEKLRAEIAFLVSEVDQRSSEIDALQPEETIVAGDKKLPYFELYLDSENKFRWRFKGSNNKIVADSSEGYTTKQNRDKGMNIVIEAIKTSSYNVKSTEEKK